MAHYKLTSRTDADNHIVKFKRSDLTRQEYCELHNIKPGTFNWWIKRSNDTKHKTESGKSSFIPVHPRVSHTNIVATESDLTIDFPSGARLKWRGKELPASFSQLLSFLNEPVVL